MKKLLFYFSKKQKANTFGHLWVNGKEFTEVLMFSGNGELPKATYEDAILVSEMLLGQEEGRIFSSQEGEAEPLFPVNNILEDFYYSVESFRKIVAEAKEQKIGYGIWFINGKEFTDRVKCGEKPPFPDSFLVLGQVLNAHEGNPKFKIACEVGE